MIDPASKTPEEWDELAFQAEIDAIVADPHPAADRVRRRAIYREIHADLPPGRRASIDAYLPYSAEFRAMKGRFYAGQRRRAIAEQCRQNAVLSSIIRATEKAEEAQS